MTIKELKKILDIDNGDIARMFGYKSSDTYANCKKAKPRLERGLLALYELIDKKAKFTGFKDERGAEIHEGDNLGDWVETEEGLVQSKKQVYWCAKTGAWMLDDSLSQNKLSGDLLSEELERFVYQVTGNIYDDENEKK